jgi:hypothetical protein
MQPVPQTYQQQINMLEQRIRGLELESDESATAVISPAVLHQ